MSPQSSVTGIWNASRKGNERVATVVFKRRTPRTYYQTVSESFYPRGGWRRAVQYIAYRVRRLPDPAHKISRGIAAGVFTCFTPFFGLHFFVAALLAWAMRGNVVAALMATFFGNPLTFPVIVSVSMELGRWMLGLPPVPIPFVVTSFSHAAVELWSNIIAIFTPESTQWGRLGDFWGRVFLPYLVGGLLPGIGTAIAAYILSNPLIAAYQKARVARMKKKFAKKREAVEAKRAASQAIVERSAAE